MLRTVCVEVDIWNFMWVCKFLCDSTFVLVFMAEPADTAEEKISEGSAHRGEFKRKKKTISRFYTVFSPDDLCKCLISHRNDVFMNSSDRELARVETEKRMSLIRAWEESEKCKAENK